jgi:hypothetical protein
VIGFVILTVLVGVLMGLAIAALLGRSAAKKTPTPTHVGISALGFDMNGNGGAEVNPQYQAMLSKVLKQLDGGAGFRTVL